MECRMKEKSNKLCFENICLLIYSLLSFIWIWMHEPWRDEAQAWLIVRDLDLGGILKQMVWEGSPALWHMLLFPLTKSGLPYVSMFILHWLIAVFAVWILLYKLPLNKFIKIGLLFSYYLIFEYVLVARNYNLTILLLFIIAWVYESRHKKPISFSIYILLLFNSNIHSFGAATALTIIFFWEMFINYNFNRKNIIALLIMLSGIILLFLQMPPIVAVKQNAIVEMSAFNFHSVFIAISNSFLPGFNLNVFSGFIFSIILLLFFIRFLIRPKIFIFLLVSEIWLFYIFGSVHGGELRHHGFIMIFIIFSLLLEKYYPIEPVTISNKKLEFSIIRKLSSIILILCLFLSIYQSIRFYHDELQFNYSGSREAAEFIKNNIPADQVIIAHRSYACSSLLPYLPEYKFWYADREEFGSFLTWDKQFMQNAYSLSNQEVKERAEKRFGGEADVAYLLTTPISEFELNSFDLLFRTKKKVFCKKDEEFYLYQRKHEK